MKKIFLLLTVLSFGITACSDDDTVKPHGTIKMTADGTERTFKLAGIFEARTFAYGNEDYLDAYAIDNNNDTNAVRITFPIVENPIQGQGTVSYREGSYDFYAKDISLEFTENNAHRLKGTFSGIFYNGMFGIDEVTRTVTNGTFDITR